MASISLVKLEHCALHHPGYYPRLPLCWTYGQLRWPCVAWSVHNSSRVAGTSGRKVRGAHHPAVTTLAAHELLVNRCADALHIDLVWEWSLLVRINTYTLLIWSAKETTLAPTQEEKINSRERTPEDHLHSHLTLEVYDKQRDSIDDSIRSSEKLNAWLLPVVVVIISSLVQTFIHQEVYFLYPLMGDVTNQRIQRLGSLTQTTRVLGCGCGEAAV